MCTVSRARFRLLAALVALAALTASGLVAAPDASAAGPSFVQQVSAHGHAGSLAVTPGSAVAAGDRLVVEVGVWNSSGGTVSGVSDSAGDSYTELTHFTGSDGTELSVWSAPVTAGGGTKPVITAKVSSTADIGVAAVEYAGLSAAAGSSVLDVQAHAAGVTSGSGTVSSGVTPAVTGNGELAIGFYADSGFGDALTAGSGFTGRVNVSPASDMELLVEDQGVGQGSTPAATAGTGPGTTWLMATLVLKHA